MKKILFSTLLVLTYLLAIINCSQEFGGNYLHLFNINNNLSQIFIFTITFGTTIQIGYFFTRIVNINYRELIPVFIFNTIFFYIISILFNMIDYKIYLFQINFYSLIILTILLILVSIIFYKKRKTNYIYLKSSNYFIFCALLLLISVLNFVFFKMQNNYYKINYSIVTMSFYFGFLGISFLFTYLINIYMKLKHK